MKPLYYALLLGLNLTAFDASAACSVSASGQTLCTDFNSTRITPNDVFIPRAGSITHQAANVLSSSNVMTSNKKGDQPPHGSKGDLSSLSPSAGGSDQALECREEMPGLLTICEYPESVSTPL